MKKNIKEGRKEEMKRKRNLKEEGITLIALVVTIIILLILAGVTVSLVVGQNGLLQRAQTASNTMANATANELTQMAKYANEVDELTSGFIAGGQEQGQGGSEQGGSGEGSGSGSGSGSGGSGSFNITQGGNAVDLATIGSKYGSDVEYNTNTYQLFYVDTAGKYSGGTPGVWLQLKSIASSTTLDRTNTSSTLGILTDSANSALWEVNPSLKSQYQTTIRGIAEGSLNSNIKGVAYLCDKTKWTDTYVASGDKTKGAYAIGGVSAEMFCDSYNQAKPSTAPTFGAKAFNANSTYGYYYIPSGTTDSSYSKVDNGTTYGGWTDYEISTETASGMYRINNTYTWLASPSAYDTINVCLVNGDNGYLDSYDVSNTYAVRPAVFLPSSIPISLKN